MYHIIFRLIAAVLFAVVAVVNWGSVFGVLYLVAGIAFGVSAAVGLAKKSRRH